MVPVGLLVGTYAVAFMSRALIERPIARLTTRLLQRNSAGLVPLRTPSAAN